jgi:DNA-binding HxlR family transcriptional regulator
MGDRWSLLIIRDIIFFGKRTYGEFLRAEERIATNILASRLQFLEGIGVLTKSPHGEDARKDIYSLTEKGLDLIPILFEMVRWSAKHDPLSEARRRPEFLRRLRTNSEELNKKTRALVRAGECLFSKQPRAATITDSRISGKIEGDQADGLSIFCPLHQRQ